MPYRNPEDKLEHDRKYREEHPAVHQRANAKYREANPEKFQKYSAAYRKRHPGANAAAVRKYKRSPRSKFTTLLRVARRRKIAVGITMEEYLKVISGGVCTYCWGALPAVGGGLDRKDSKVGYVPGNCIPCCEVCNEIRGHDNISYEEMFHVIRLLKSLRGET